MTTITAQDFTTAELIEALEKRGLQVLNAAKHAEITKSAREAERAACIQILEARIAWHTEMIDSAVRDGFSADAYRTARSALRSVRDEIRARGGK